MGYETEEMVDNCVAAKMTAEDPAPFYSSTVLSLGEMSSSAPWIVVASLFNLQSIRLSIPLGPSRH